MEMKAYYFSHDANARHDPNICEMRAEYGMEGYGIYWSIIEMLREQEEYKLNLKRTNAIAMQTHSDKVLIKNFIGDCIEKFDLFESDGEWFWSKSLLRRMKLKEQRSEKARKSAEARWGNSKKMRTHSECNAIKEKKRKGKKKSPEKKQTIKIKKKKPCKHRHGEYKHVLLTNDEYTNLLKKWGKKKLQFMIKRLDEGIEMKGYSYKNHNLAIQNWEKRQTDIPTSEPTEYEFEDE